VDTVAREETIVTLAGLLTATEPGDDPGASSLNASSSMTRSRGSDEEDGHGEDGTGGGGTDEERCGEEELTTVPPANIVGKT
jgi:hypothetical protein